MEKRKIGNTGLYTAPLIFGGNVLGWTADEKMSFILLDEFIDKGFNMIDTANIYSRWASGIGGESETIIGKWLKARNNRSKVIIASKVGMDMGGDNKGLSEKYILKAIDQSLLRLQTDYIDLYQSHQDDLDTAPEETLSAYDKLIKAGKIKYIGASNFSAERLALNLQLSEKNNLPRYECLQPHYNLLRRDKFEGALEQLCLEKNIGVITYYSLASGFLTGKYRSAADNHKSPRGGDMDTKLDERGKRILNVLDEISAGHECAQATVALAWLAAKPSVTAPIASATNPAQLKALMDLTRIRLREDDIKKLDECAR